MIQPFYGLKEAKNHKSPGPSGEIGFNVKYVDDWTAAQEEGYGKVKNLLSRRKSSRVLPSLTWEGNKSGVYATFEA